MMDAAAESQGKAAKPAMVKAARLRVLSNVLASGNATGMYRDPAKRR